MLLVGLIAFAVVNGINSRIKAASVVRQETIAQSVISVEVIHAKRGAMKDEISLPGNIMAFSDAPVYARTSGYLKKWYFTTHRHASSRQGWQVLAEIESPESRSAAFTSAGRLRNAQAPT